MLLTVDRYGIEVESAVFENQNVTVYDNLVVNTRDIVKAISPDYVDHLENNRFSSSLEILDEALIVPDSFQLLEQVSMSLPLPIIKTHRLKIHLRAKSAHGFLIWSSPLILCNRNLWILDSKDKTVLN